MRRYVIVFLLGSFALAAFKGSDYTDPDFVNQPYFIKRDSTYQKLEKQVSESGYMGLSNCYKIDGAISPVRIKVSTPSFIIKLDNPGIDPETMWVLTKCGKTRQERFVYVSFSSWYTYVPGGSVKKSYVKLNYEKINPGIYKITTVAPIEPGEYVFFIATDQGGQSGSRVALFCFGKD